MVLVERGRCVRGGRGLNELSLRNEGGGRMSAAARCVVALALLPGIAGFVFENGFLPSYVPAPVEPAVRNQTHNPSPLIPSPSPTASPRLEPEPCGERPPWLIRLGTEAPSLPTLCIFMLSGAPPWRPMMTGGTQLSKHTTLSFLNPPLHPPRRRQYHPHIPPPFHR